MKIRIQDVDVWSGFVLRVRKSRVAGSRTIAAVLVAVDVFAVFCICFHFAAQRVG